MSFEIDAKKDLNIELNIDKSEGVLAEEILDKKIFLENFKKISLTNFGEEEFSKWFARLEIFSISISEIILLTDSKFVRDWINREFIQTKIKSKNILKIISDHYPKIKKISIIFIANQKEQREGENSSKETNKKTDLEIPAKIFNLSKYNNVFAFGTELNPNYTFTNFIDAKYNKMALSMAKIVSGIDAQKSLFNDNIPLFIHGGVGIGKTHLAQAIAWQIRENNQDKKVVYLSAEKFMYHFVQSIRNKDAMDFKEKMRSIDVLIVDDIQFIAGKEGTQQEFMNSFNHLVSENKQVVLVCDKRPNELENIDEKLKSRISGGMIINFKNPDFLDRVNILKAKAALANFKISDEVINFLAERISSNIRDLEGAMRKLIYSNMIDEKEININSAAEIVGDYLINKTSQKCDVKKIQKIVSQFYEIKISDLCSNNRSRNFSLPRQIAMYLAKNLTSESLSEIGKLFGDKNHATVIHSHKKIKQRIAQDVKFLCEIKSIEEKLSAS